MVTKIDVRVLEWVVRRRRQAADEAAKTLAAVGRGGGIWIALGGLVAWRVGSRRFFFANAAVVAAAHVASTALARVVDRTRPCHRAPQLALIECPDGPSLPSDQAAAAAAGAMLLASEVPVLTGPVVALATAIAVARVYAGVHYPSDVAAGSAVGTAVAWAAVRVRLPA